MANDDKKTASTTAAPSNHGERLDKLERQLSESMAESKELRGDVKALTEENQRLSFQVEEFEAALASGAPVAAVPRKDKKGEIPPGFFRNAKGLLVAEEYRGEKKYELSEPIFRGRLMHAGERLTVVDEQPGTTWRPLIAQVQEQLVAGPLPTSVRAADREV